MRFQSGYSLDIPLFNYPRWQFKDAPQDRNRYAKQDESGDDNGAADDRDFLQQEFHLLTLVLYSHQSRIVHMLRS